MERALNADRDPAVQRTGRYLSTYGTQLHTQFAEVEKYYSTRNAVLAMRLRIVNEHMYAWVRDYMAGVRVDDPDEYIGTVLAEALELTERCNVDDEELKRHARRRQCQKDSRIELCLNWARSARACEFGMECRYFHAEYKQHGF